MRELAYSVVFFERHNEELPKAPVGLGNEPGLVRREEPNGNTNLPKRNDSVRPWGASTAAWGIAWVVAGMCFLLVQPTIGCVIGSYGTAIVLNTEGKHKGLALGLSLALSGLACSVLSIVQGSWADGVDVLLNAVLMAFVMVVVSMAVGSKKPATQWVCVAGLVGSVAYLGIGELEAVLGGTTMVAMVNDIVSQIASIETTLSTRAQLGNAVSLISLFWPMAFVLMACIWVACCYLGARLGLRSVGKQVEDRNTFSNFEVPLWVVALLLGGVVALVAARILPWWASQLTMVGANVAMTARVALAVQGLALLSWLMRRHGVSVLLQALVFVMAAYLEVSFFVMSVVGLVDVWANFRHLSHGATPAKSESSK